MEYLSITRVMIHSLFLISTLLFARSNYVSETSSEWLMQNRFIQVRVSKTTGDITKLVVKNNNIISNPISEYVHEVLPHETEAQIVDTTLNDQWPEYISLSIEKKYNDKVIEKSYTLDTSSLHFELKITTRSKEDKEIKIDYIIPLIKSMTHFFLPIQDSPCLLSTIENKKFTYRKDIIIPTITFYNVHDDYGLSISVPFKIPKPTLLFSIDEKNLTISFQHLRISQTRGVTVAICLVPHEADWRPGFAFLLRRYPEFFYPSIDKTRQGEGWYIQGGVYDTEETVRRAASNGAQWNELHYYFPFYGLYVPDMDTWGLIANSDAVSLSDWEQGAGKKRNNYNQMKQLIRLWHKYGIQVYIYFQSFEAWHQYAREYFAEDIALDKNNSKLPAWKFTNLMNPEPESKWGQHIINQARNLLKKYPEVDGIFYDRMDYWNYDFAHDDNITMVNDNPTYMLGFAQEKISEIVCAIFHKNGKMIWGNLPTSIEVCKNVDGIMAETHLSNLYKIQYIGLAKPIVFLPYDRKIEQTERKLKNSLHCGAFPSISYGGEECQKLDQKFRPLFDLIKNREWVLSAKPIKIPGHLKGNIFRTPKGDYVAVITNHERSQIPPHPFEYKIPLSINLPDISDIKKAYLLSGDWQGVNSIDFKKKKTTMKINLPVHLSSSVIYLTKEEKYKMVRLSSPVLIKGKNEDLIFMIGDSVSDTAKTFTLETPWSKQSKVVHSKRVKFHTQIPEDIEGECEIKIKYNGIQHKMSSWIVDPISITPKEDIFIKFQEGEDVPFFVANNSPVKSLIAINGEFIAGSGKIEALDKFTLQSLENKEIKIPITAKTDGVIQLVIDIGEKKIEKSFPIKTGLSFGKDDLFHDDFRNGMKNWIINRGEWDVSNGFAQGSGPAHFALIKNDKWQNYLFEVRTRILGSDNPEVDWLKSYIFFRVQDENNCYRYGIHGDAGVIDLYKLVGGKWIKLGSYTFSPTKDEWYVLRISVEASKITGYLNGEKIIETNDTTFTSGGIGIGVLEDAMRCEYKDVVVKRL